MRITVFIASPGDVEERHGPIDQVLEQLNATLCRDLAVTLDAVRWESDAPRGPANRLQGAINPILDDADIVIVLFWRRFGTPSGLAPSGTAEEYTRALKLWKERGYPRPLIYFSDAQAPPPHTIDAARQLLEIARLRQAASTDGLVGTYSTPNEFSTLLGRDLYKMVTNVVELRRLPIERGLAASLDRERIACQQADRPFLTPSLLIALLKRPDGLLRRALENLEPNLSVVISAWLEKATQKLSVAPEHPFVPFNWMDRADFTTALSIAQQDGHDRISERHLFAAAIRRDGSTIAAFRRILGVARFNRLVEAIQTNAVSIGYHHLFDQNELPE